MHNVYNLQMWLRPRNKNCRTTSEPRAGHPCSKTSDGTYGT